MKNMGKMRKFITPAKFSSWRMREERNMPRAESVRPVSTSTGSSASRPASGTSVPHSQAMARKA